MHKLRLLYCVLEIEKGPIHPPSWSIDHRESLVLAKQVEESHKKLKQEHRELAHKYQELEFAYEAIDPSLENFADETIKKVNASTSCDDLLINANATNIVPELAPSREKELMDQVAKPQE